MNKTIEISRISKKAKRICDIATSGYVLSIFDKVVNIMTEEGILCLQEQEIPFTPFSVVLERPFTINHLNLNPGSILIFESQTIKSNTFFCQLQEAKIHETSLKNLHIPIHINEKLPWLIEMISTYLNSYLQGKEVDGGLLNISNHMSILDTIIVFSDSVPNTILIEYVKKKLEGLNITKEDFPVVLASLVGLGHGLTPSCDDFIVGLISSVAFLKYKSEQTQIFITSLYNEVELKLPTTTSVSSAFLESSLSLNFSEPLLEFYSNIIYSDEKHIELSLKNISDIGHSSGIDSLNGILFGLKLVVAINHL